MVQQAYPKHSLHLQGIKWALCYTLHWRAKTQTVLHSHTKHQTTRRRKLEVVRHPLQQRGSAKMLEIKKNIIVNESIKRTQENYVIQF